MFSASSLCRAAAKRSVCSSTGTPPWSRSFSMNIAIESRRRLAPRLFTSFDSDCQTDDTRSNPVPPRRRVLPEDRGHFIGSTRGRAAVAARVRDCCAPAAPPCVAAVGGALALRLHQLALVLPSLKLHAQRADPD